jgi:YggT family protein
LSSKYAQNTEERLSMMLKYALIIVLITCTEALHLSSRRLPMIAAALTTIVASPVLAETDPVLSSLFVIKPSLDILINTMSVLFLARTIMSWYPKTDIRKFPYNAIVWPTEPLMQPARELLPPAFGVDISSIFWLGLLSFIREILTGQQGVLTLMENN